MSGLDGSGVVHTVLPWEAFGGHVPSGGSEMYWFDHASILKDTCLRHAQDAPAGHRCVAMGLFFPDCALVLVANGSGACSLGTRLYLVEHPLG